MQVRLATWATVITASHDKQQLTAGEGVTILRVRVKFGG